MFQNEYERDTLTNFEMSGVRGMLGGLSIKSILYG